MSGRDIPTFITEVKAEYADKSIFKDIIKEKDIILLSRVASETAQYRTFAVEQDDKRYCSIPIMQILGIFKDNVISYDSLEMITNKILVKKVESIYQNNSILYANDNTMIGKVVKVGTTAYKKDWTLTPLTVKVGDIVLLRDNVSTEIMLNGDIYYAIEESMIVGIFKEGTEKFSLEDLSLINEYVLMESFIPKNVLNSTLETPNLNFEDEDVTDIYNRNVFEIIKADENSKEFKPKDIVMLDRNFTNYTYFQSEKFFIINADCIEAKIY